MKAGTFMPETEVPSTALKADARKLIIKTAPKPFIVSLFFVVVMTAISEGMFRFPGFLAAYTQYVDLIAFGTPHNLGLFLSFLSPAGFVIAVLLWLLGGVIRLGFKSYCLNTVSGRRVSAFDLLDGFLFLGKVLLTILAVTALTLIWSALFVVPGIFAFYRYRQALYVLLDDPQKGVMQCIRESTLLMRGNKLDLLLIDFSFLGWTVFSSLLTLTTMLALPFSLPLASIWISPYMGLCHAAFYKQLLSKATA